MSTKSSQLAIIDSHTCGELTRVIIDGAPDLGGTSRTMAERRTSLANDHDWVRSATVNEPRGSDAMVGALLCEPHAENCAAGVIFFNNVGYLDMCIHGTIGVAITLYDMGKIGPGTHRIDTPVGVVTAEIKDASTITVSNVPSYLAAENIQVNVPDYGIITGDIAWGGNWFFLIDNQGPDVKFANIDALHKFTASVRLALAANNITGPDDREVDHIESFGPPADENADSRNFVLCPGNAYDRSPCGTGTSAKLAALYARGKLRAGEVWRQASILNTVFTGTFEPIEGTANHVIPSITGTAFVNGKYTVIFNPDDPFRHGITAQTV